MLNRQRTDTELADPGNVTLGHKSVQRWNLPDGWVISSRPPHTRRWSARTTSWPRKTSTPPEARSRRTHRSCAATCWPGSACGVCGRRMESAWSNWPGGSGWATARASGLRISRTVSGMRPSWPAVASGQVGGRAWVPVRSPEHRGDDGADRESGHDQHDVPEDRGIKTGLALVQAEAALCQFEALLPPASEVPLP